MFRDIYLNLYYGILISATYISLSYLKKVDKPFALLCLLILLTAINEFIAGYLYFCRKPNGIVYLIFTPVEYFIYAMIYKIFLNDKKWTRILFISFACLIVLEIVNTIFYQRLSIPTNIMSIESVLLVILSLKLFIKIREEPVYENVLNEGVFWFNSAVLVYYSFDILIWGFHSLVYHLKDPPRIIYNILQLFSGLLYLTYGAAIFLNYFSINKTLSKDGSAFANKR